MWAAGGASPDREMVYKRVGDLELRLHVFLPEDHAASDRRPAIVFFHGGGWNQGSPAQFYHQSRYLASRGMVAISAQYRLRDPRFGVEDGKSAIRWVRRNAAELGIDPDRIAAGGGSAGGQIAAAAGTTSAFEQEGEDPGIPSRPNALVLFNPVFDNGPGGYGHERVQEYWRAFSPMHNIHAGTPPTIVLSGTRDDRIPAETVRAYQRRMEELGLRCDVRLYEGQRHGFFNTHNRRYFALTVIEMDRFLASLGYLEGEPTLPAP